MLFNSLDFAVFLPSVFFLYWFVFNKNLKHQNLLIVVSSYYFYGLWDWRFLFLIFFSTLVDYSIGKSLLNVTNQKKRKGLLLISVFVNLGLLVFFKYYNFFLDNFIATFKFFGHPIDIQGLNIILPVGISFYTFQTMSYTIDVYRKKIEPTDNFITFCAFVSFFPQLVAGPIERASHLLPQFTKKRTLEYDKAVDGMKQILWGLFKKMVIADNCALFANQIFDNSSELNGSTLLLGAVFFAFQIYGDFSGYSDIAIGVARLFGFDLMRNFAFPYFSRDVAEFWRRWHISLSTWFRDYLYIPLGGSRGSNWMKIRNIFIIFLVSGFWHGANWTFLVWGALNAFYFLPLLLSKKNRTNIDIIAQGKFLPSFKDFLAMVFTFFITTIAWVFFRANTIQHAGSYVSGIFSSSLFDMPHFKEINKGFTVILLLLFFIFIEWCGRESQFAIENIGVRWPRIIRWSFYSFLIFCIGMFMATYETPFIYFQF